MPWRIDRTDQGAPEKSGASEHRPPAPVRILVWPHRSLGPRGFAAFILITFALFLVPLLAVIGTLVLWAVLPFVLATLWGLWVALRRNTAEALLTEEVVITPDEIRVLRREPDGRELSWQANPYWVRIRLRDDGPVEKYLTLAGAGREIELGAFLSPEERAALRDVLEDELRRVGRGL